MSSRKRNKGIIGSGSVLKVERHRNGWEVEDILNHGINPKDGEHYYRVKWYGWSEKYYTWEVLGNLDRELVERFHLRHNIPLPECYKYTSRTKESAMVDDLIGKLCEKYQNRSIEVKRLPEGLVKVTVTADPNLESLVCDVETSLTRWEHMINSVEWAATKNGGHCARIFVENKVDFESPPMDFTYICGYKRGINVPDLDVDPPIGCSCSDCSRERKKCCAANAGVEMPYDRWGRVCVDPGRPIYECNSKCKCGPDCLNRVVQKGRRVPLCIFRTVDGRGWGVKTSDTALRKGDFVMEYAGEVRNVYDAG